MPTPAIILAAGASRRLGTPKQSVLWEGEALLHRTARVALEAGFEPVYVVVGAATEASREALAGLPVAIVPNPDWEEGMGASIRAGMAALSEDAKAVLLLVCDQPLLTRGHLGELLRCHLAGMERVLASVYGGVRGVPALFPKDRFPDLCALAGDRGARGLLQGKEVGEIVFVGGEVDVDTPGDLVSKFNLPS